MNHSPQWPVSHILVGIPIVLAVSYLCGGAMKGWGTGEETILASATMVAVVGPSYTFLAAAIERSYYMVFWAREKIKNQWEEAQRDAQAKGAAKANRAWRAWYERMQAAQREGRPFVEPPPDPPSREEEQ